MRRFYRLAYQWLARRPWHVAPVDVLPWLRHGVCPDCGGLVFLPGPRGGAAVNISCADCGSRFNVAAPDYGVIFYAERIGKPHPYRDKSCLARPCDRCDKVYRGPAVYCSFQCAVDDA